ncbi:putative WD40-like Beta Propeller Repeat [Lyophyllum shimeji]|uniref:Dipeptidyl-peptidase V n=1 Tax=Lyophyllum shimeji TaxID=47721 RepID=A0A9P3PUC5_LYOSH|nr:putative WD40-like Beta Propeller Repeat [Lyophyllum shimeji]
MSPPHRALNNSRRSRWPAQIASTQKVRDVRISPDGSMVLYQVQPFYKAVRSSSELWLARPDIPQSARPLTKGEFNDKAGVFHPDGQRVVFLSDRYNVGKSVHIYIIDLRRDDAEPVLLSQNFGTKNVLAFEISPNGHFIAFTSHDDAISEDKARKIEEKDDAEVFGGSEVTVGFARLRVYSFSTGMIWTLEGVGGDRHIEAYTWSPDSTRLLYRLRRGRGPEFAEQEVTLQSISVKDPCQTPCTLGIYPRSPSGQNIWTSSGHVVTLQSYEPSNILDARALFTHSIDHLTSLAKGGQRLYGITEDAVRIVDAGQGVGVEVCSDVDTNIDIVSFDEDTQELEKRVTIFQTQQEAIWFGAWDAKRVVDDAGNVSYVFAAVLSSGVRHEPLNVWSRRVSDDGRELSPKLQLSSHLQWLADAPPINTEVMQWTTTDGVLLSGLIRYPPAYDVSHGPLPTVLFIHGGPYRRDIPDYMPYFCNWRELLALEGYLVISPNYRGSQGRGHEFAHAASQGIGAHDWPDCESMVDEMIRRGLADPGRLGVAGWSHGGSLTAWGVTKTKTRFKAAIVGAGVSNWEAMVTDSGSPELETEIGRSGPWDHDDPARSVRKTSPIHSVAGVTTAVLILHGKKDERVPVSQGIGLWRGLKRRAADRGREAAQLVLYPREPHGFVERKHAEDVLKRVLCYFDTWL